MVLEEALNLEDGSSCASDRLGAAAAWRPGRVVWRHVLLQQDWGSVAATAAVLAACGVLQSSLGGPRARPFAVTDATLSFPHSDTTIPYWAVILASLAALVATVLVAEAWVARRRGLHGDATDAAAAALHFVLDGICAFLATGAVTQVSKMVVGRLRPDFLDRCRPAVPDPLTVRYGLPAAANPACMTPGSTELTDGHYSFPSGHTSTAFVFSIWTAGYSLWAFTCRCPRPPAATLHGMPLRQRLGLEAAATGAWLWVLALLLYAWFVGVSRITDFKHHPSDVAAGAFLGTLLGCCFVTRAIWRLDGVVASSGGRGSAGGRPPPGESGLQQQEAALLPGMQRGSNRVHHYAAGSTAAV